LVTAPQELHTLWQESLFLPKELRTPFYEDVLLDALLSRRDDLIKVTTRELGVKYVTHYLFMCIQDNAAIRASDVVGRLTTKLLLYLSGTPVDNNGSLGKLLSLGQKADKVRLPLMVISHSDSNLGLTLRLPKIDLNDGLNVDNVGILMKFISILLSIKLENIKIVTDSDLGDVLTLNKSQINLAETFSSSARHPAGLFLGEYYKFSTGYTANLVGIIASMRIISHYKQYLRPLPKSKSASQALRVNFSDLQETFNLKSGLKAKSDYTSLLMKEVFKNLVSASQKRFPGGWLNSAKVSNSTKSTVGLLFKMGWVERVPLKSKILDVVYNDVVEVSPTKLKIENIKVTQRNTHYSEYRTGVALLLPLINPSSKVPLDEQISVDPLKIDSDIILDSFSEKNYVKMVDKLNHTQALKQSCTAPNSKTKPIHYRMARNELLHLSDKVTLKDASGLEYQKHSDIPEHVSLFLRKKLSFPVKRAKTQTESSEEKVPEVNLPKRQKTARPRPSGAKGKTVAGEDLSPNIQDTEMVDPSVQWGLGP